MNNMDLMAMLSTIVLIATVATTLFAIAAYVTSRGYGRKKKGPKSLSAKTAGQSQTPILKRYIP